MNIEQNQSEIINEVASICFGNAVNKRFHDGDNCRMNVDNFARWTANLHGEVSELWEAARKGDLNKPCDKAAFMEDQLGFSMTCAEEELADIVIRAFDTAAAFGVNIGEAIAKKHAYNLTRPPMHGKLA